MQREIKFRAWDKVNKRWLSGKNEAYGWQIWGQGGGIAAVPVGWDGSEEDSAFVLMQYTGLRDKKGTAIFEGDVIQRTFADGQVAAVSEVTWYQGAFWVHELDDESGVLLSDVYDHVGPYLEVIGNVFESPELLEAAK